MKIQDAIRRIDPPCTRCPYTLGLGTHPGKRAGQVAAILKAAVGKGF